VLEQGQGLYFTPKRARKFKVETVCNLSPGPQQGTYGGMVPQPHTREPHHHGASIRNPGVTATMRQGERGGFLSSSQVWQPCQREIHRITHLPPKGNWQGSNYFSSPNTLQRTYTRGGWQTLQKAKPSSSFGNAARTSSVILSKKVSQTCLLQRKHYKPDRPNFAYGNTGNLFQFWVTEPYPLLSQESTSHNALHKLFNFILKPVKSINPITSIRSFSQNFTPLML